MANTVIGFFDDAQEAQDAIEKLQQRGISNSNIDMSSGGLGSTSNTSSDQTQSSSYGDSHEKEGNAISRFFNSLFGDDSDDARKYSRVGSSSNYIVTVHASSADEAEEVADIMDDCGAIDVDERASSFSEDRYDLSGSTSTQQTTGGTDYPNRQGESVNRIEEELQVGKRQVETGRTRLRSRIVETPVEEHVRLREEHVNIERIPVDREVSADDLGNFREQNIELTERAEVPVVNKEARVVEEIRLNKEVDERDEVIRDTVRKTEVDIDQDQDTRRVSNNNLNSNNKMDDRSSTDDNYRL